MKHSYKLGNQAISFTDPRNSISITKTSPYTSDTAIHQTSEAFARAVKGGQLHYEAVEDAPETSKINIYTASASTLEKLTSKEFMSLIEFMEQEDIDKVASCRNKAGAVKLFLEIREDYDFNE